MPRSGLRQRRLPILLSALVIVSQALLIDRPSGASNPSCNDAPSHSYSIADFNGTAFGNESTIYVGSPGVPPSGGTIVQHLFVVGNNGGLEVGWLIGEELGDGGGQVGFTTSPIAYVTNNTSGSGYIEENGPIVGNNSTDWYATWFSGNIEHFRIDNAYEGSVIWSGSFDNQSQSGAIKDGAEVLSSVGVDTGSNTFTYLEYLKSSGSWANYGSLVGMCNDPNLSITYGGAGSSLYIADSGKVA